MFAIIAAEQSEKYPNVLPIIAESNRAIGLLAILAVAVFLGIPASRKWIVGGLVAFMVVAIALSAGFTGGQP